MSNPAIWDLTYAIAGFVDFKYDYIGVTYPTASTETYTWRNGGASGTIIAAITITYTDATKASLSSVLRTV